MIGVAGFALVYDAAIWNRLFPGRGQLPSMGEVVRRAGAVRYRQDGTVTWRDVSGRGGVSAGDTVFTGEDGRAEIRMENAAIEVFPNSLVRIQAPESAPAAGLLETWEAWLKPRPVIRFDQGGGKSTGLVRVRVRERAFEISAPVEFSVSGSGELQLAPSPGAAAPAVRELGVQGKPEPEAAPRVILAQPVSPRSGRVLYLPAATLGGLRAPPLVPFRWSFSGASGDVSGETVGELVVGALDSPGTASSVSLQGGWGQRFLEAGAYRWRVTGRGWASPWEEFQVVVLERPQLAGPRSGATLAPLDSASADSARPSVEVSFLWEPLPVGFSAEVEISGTGKRILPSNAFGLRVGLEPGEYTWRARSVGPEGVVSEWSETRPFRVALSRPVVVPVPALVTPPEPPAPAPVSAPEPVRPEPAPVARKVTKLELLPSVAVSSVKPVKAAEPAPAPVVNADQATASTRLGSADDLDSLRIALQWKPVPGAKSYFVEVLDAEGESIAQERVHEARKVLTLNSLRTVQYKYRVEVTLEDSSKITSPWTTIRITLAPPVPKLPAEGSVQSSDEGVLLTWESTVLTRRYLVQVSSSRAFDREVEQEKTDRNFQVIRPGRAGKHYWRVKSLTDGVASQWSAPSSFTVQKPASSEENP